MDMFRKIDEKGKRKRGREKGGRKKEYGAITCSINSLQAVYSTD
jgi:hypothetical protein